MKEKTEKGRGYLTGVIAVVFLIIGYQTALFVHQAAVMKIAANRDEPDTVYVYPEQYATDNGSYSTSDRTVKSARMRTIPKGLRP